jgi:hypothetical protein
MPAPKNGFWSRLFIYNIVNDMLRDRGLFLTETVRDEPSLEQLKTEMMLRSSNCCCVCQIPFVHAHHINGNNANNTFDNLAPLCPNHHALAHSRSNMVLNLNPERIKTIRDQWYQYVERRKQLVVPNLGVATLRVKNFVSNRVDPSEYASRSWAKTFSSLDQGYRDLSVSEIIDRVFSDSNPENFKTYLQTMKTMYARVLQSANVQKEFKEVCNAFGFDFDGNTVN